MRHEFTLSIQELPLPGHIVLIIPELQMPFHTLLASVACTGPGAPRLQLRAARLPPPFQAQPNTGLTGRQAKVNAATYISLAVCRIHWNALSLNDFRC
jgi:hypothetical protein